MYPKATQDTLATSSLYNENILMILIDACTINILLALALALASAINYTHKGCHSLEKPLLATLELSVTIVICLKYRPQQIKQVEWVLCNIYVVPNVIIKCDNLANNGGAVGRTNDS